MNDDEGKEKEDNDGEVRNEYRKGVKQQNRP